MTPPSSGPTPLNPRGRGDADADAAETRSASGRSESSISNEAQAVRTLASAHRLAGEIENEARRRADEIRADAELSAVETEREARARAEALVAEATAERDRIWEQIRAGVGQATRQVGDLLRIREELRLDLQEAMRESSSALNRLDEAEVAGEPPPRPVLPARDALEGRATAVGPSPLSPGGAAQPAAPGVQPAPAPRSAPAEAPEADVGLLSLRAGPFESFLAVMRFERALAALDPIEAVYVRRFSQGDVDVEVDTPDGPESVAEAIRGLDQVEAVEPSAGMLRVRVRPAPAERG